MCGITGLIDATSTGFLRTDFDIFWGLMLINSMRGKASTGTFGVGYKNKADIYKTVGHPFEWDKWDVSDEFSKRFVSQYKFAIAHGRLPTHGSPNISNAHPFYVNGITLVHNGTIRNFQELNNKFGKKCEVDSQLLTFMIGDIGIHETVKLIQGAYALVWHDEKQEGIFVLRNSERPLTYLLSSSETRMVIGSEKHYCNWANSKTHYSSAKVEDFTPHEMYNLKVENNKIKIDKTRASPYQNNSNHSRSYYGGMGYGDDVDLDPNVPTSISLPKVTKSTSAVYVPPTKVSREPEPVIVCVDEDLIFLLRETIQVNSPETKNIVTMIKGVIPGSTNYTVIGHYEGDIDKFNTEMGENKTINLQGRVRSIFPVAATKDLIVNIFVTDISPYKNNVVKLPDNATVILKDKNKISQVKFLEYAKEGCAACNDTPDIKEAHLCSLDTYYRNETEEAHVFLCPKCAGTENDRLVVH